LYGTLVTKVEEDKKWVEKEVENFEVIVPSQEVVTGYNFTKYVLITSPCSPDSTAQLCIHTGAKDDQECKTVECNEEPLEDFILADNSIDYEKGKKDSLLSPSTWLKYLNPAEWFNGITGMQEGVVMVVGIVAFFILLAILIKLCHCFNCVFRCFKCCFKFSCLRSCSPEDKYCEPGEEDLESQAAPVRDPSPGGGLVMSNYQSNIKMYNITVMGDQIVNKNGARSSTKIGSDFDYEDRGPKSGWDVEKSPKCPKKSGSFDSISKWRKSESSSCDWDIEKPSNDLQHIDKSPKKSQSFDSISTKCGKSSGSFSSGEWDFEKSSKKCYDSQTSSETYFTANLTPPPSYTPDRYQIAIGAQINIWGLGNEGLDSSSETVFPDTFLCLESPDIFPNMFPNKNNSW